MSEFSCLHVNRSKQNADVQKKNSDRKPNSFSNSNPLAQLQEEISTSPKAMEMAAIQEMADNSPQAVQMRKFQEIADNSPQAVQMRAIQKMADNYVSPYAMSNSSDPVQKMDASEEDELQMKQAPLQKMGDVEEELQMKKSTQLQAVEEEVQMKSDSSTKMPEDVQAKMENSFGADFSNVNIHVGEKASSVGALAYAQGNDIHFAPGQYNPETQSGQELLGHELTHVVQQRQGRVQATTQAKGIAVNDDPALENEADVMGKKAAQNEKANIAGHTRSNVQAKKVAQKSDDQEALDRIASQQAIYEFAAHHLAYETEGYELSKEEFKFLYSAGYDPNTISWYGRTGGGVRGFQAVLIPSRTRGKNHILAVRGTVPGADSESLNTIFTDLDPQAVGTSQFASNRRLIATILNSANGPVDVTGHSLGGAMAQHIAINFPGQVKNVSTFQAPGIDQASVNRFNQIPEDQRPEVVHHIVTGDIVDKAGQASLPGDVFEHDFGRHLDVRELLNTVTTSLSQLGADIALFQQTVQEITIMAAIPTTLVNPLTIQNITAKISLLSQIKNRISRNIQNLRSYLGEVGEGVGESHGAHVFASGHYAGMRGSMGLPDSAMGDRDMLNRNARVTHHTQYPHEAQRRHAEPIRRVIGLSVQNMFRAYIDVIQTYERMVEMRQRLIQGMVNMAQSISRRANSTMQSASDRIGRAWNYITN
ncbi:MAG: DUF4157 domain-containing protein [Cytophagaceae bacterium]